MIFSASRRTDIPAFFGDWILERLRRGEAAVRNPMNSRQITYFKFDPAAVDCLVFWTKNPAAFLPRLDALDELGYRYYFQFTITPYGRDLEQNLDKGRILETFIRLSERLGRHRVIWRYDPVIINNSYPTAFQVDRFCGMAEKLCGHTEQCVISFVDRYPFLAEAARRYDIAETPAPEAERFVGQISRALESLPAKIRLSACCEKLDLSPYGVGPGACVDGELIARIRGVRGEYRKDPSQRKECGCVQSRDLGTYNTCLHGCVYCYAGRGGKKGPCDRDSPLLCDTIDAARDAVKLVDLRRGPNSESAPSR